MRECQEEAGVRECQEEADVRECQEEAGVRVSGGSWCESVRRKLV